MKKCECSACHADEGGVAVLENNTCESSDGCGCESHGRDSEITSVKQDVMAIITAVILSLAAYFAPDSIAKTLFFAAAILVAGMPIFWQGLKNIFKLDLEEMALLTIAVIAACLIGEMPEAVMVTILFRVGGIFEDVAAAKSRREIEAVTNIIPDNANLVLPDGPDKIVSARTLIPGNIVRIKSGERVPVDCKVLSGSSSMDSSSLTGESVSREVQAGDAILSGMVNLGGVLTCEATNSFDNSTASKIVQMVRDSAAKKGGTERIISRFARVYTPIVIIIAILVAVLPPILGFGAFTQWINRALVFLVASCPCALVIATPLAFFAGIGGCSKQGILVKGSKYMEALAGAKAVVFDKTGTLTTGALTIDEVLATEHASKDEVMLLAAICESDSNHPIAKAIAAAGPENFPKAESCEEITAYGMSAVVDGAKILCGSARLMEKFDVALTGLPEANVYVAKNGEAIGGISVFDAPRAEAAETLIRLRGQNITRTAMLTGDSTAAAEKTAKLIGITEVHAQLLPQDKVEIFRRIKSGETTGKSLFVGDGINDSPVIAASDAGVAMGISSDAAIEAADVVLLSDKLLSLPQAIGIAKRTMGLVRFNIAFALIIKFAVFVLAFFGIASMWMAVFADVGVSIISVLNSTRALRFK